jgi:rhamnosyltransferase
MPEVAAVVILYNPDLNVIDNLDTYINQVRKVFVVDNSDNINETLVQKIHLYNNTEYICNHSNLGIAAALNIAANRAIIEGFQYLLTMDQDSKASEEMINILIKNMQFSNNIGIAAADYINPSFQSGEVIKFTKEADYTITSGNLLNLSAYKIVGEFLDELFIDHVDHEYCLRLRKYGFRIIKTSETIIYHKIGNAVKKDFLNFHFHVLNHSPLRLYYRTRNRLYVNSIYKREFPDYVREDKINMLREILEIILFEKAILKKIKMIFTGYWHFKKKILGKYQNVNLNQ